MTDQLKPSDRDCIALAAAIAERFGRLMSEYLMMHGTMPAPDQSIQKDVILWDRMFKRHSQGDLRNTDSEYQATKNVAQWTVDLNCKLRGQPPKQLCWKD